jgi:hypothetical protein
MENKNDRFIRTGIRDPNPCYNCTRPEKKPGCHDTCKYHKEWKAELERVKEAKRMYNRRMYNKFMRY